MAKEKYTTYLNLDVFMALKRFALAKRAHECDVVEAALRKALPEKYFRDPYAANGKPG